MSLAEIEGDLFATPGLDALAHGVNCRGVMGAGIAVEFKRRWPAMFQNYQHLCTSGHMEPGDIMTWRTLGRDPWIYNLATQAEPGPWATVPAIETSLDKMAKRAVRDRVRRVGMPRIGCGLGGLDYRDVRPLIERAAREVDIVVVSLPKSRRGARR